MNHADFKLVIAETFETINQLTASKGVEYSNSDDQLANFKRLATELGLSPEAVNLVFLTKHLDSIKHYVRNDGKQSSSEPIHGRIDDAILYLILLKSLIIEQQTEHAEAVMSTLLNSAVHPSSFMDSIAKPKANFDQDVLSSAPKEECDCPICKPEAYLDGYLPVVQIKMAKVGELSDSQIELGTIPNFLKKDPNDTAY